MRKVLVTGSSGFIGFHLCRKLLDQGHRVIGIDNLCDYYDVTLKRRRQAILMADPNFAVINAGIETADVLHDLFARERPEIVVHLAAQAGVRYSVENPRSYLESNIVGSFELLEAAAKYPPRHMLFASTSSAYGASEDLPYLETGRSDHPLSFYAATKKASEAMTHSYAYMHGIPITMFRFFTVYGPWGRPDMALFKFTKAMLHGDAIDIYNGGEMWRDFTYIADLVTAISLLMDALPDHRALTRCAQDSLSPVAPWRLVNIGTATAVKLDDLISSLERALDRPARRNLLPMQIGDVPITCANTDLLHHLTRFRPQTQVEAGVRAFVDWYQGYYGYG